jgi:HPt (histidine-containing phosphotransfer) domain-containing protein
MQMPSSSPVQLAGRLRRACGRNTLLLAMSGSRPASTTLARYDGFLLKPFGAAELAPLIASAHAAHTLPRSPKKTSAAATPAKPSRAAKKPAAKKPSVTLALAASAEQPASKHRMDAAPHSSAPPADSAPILDETIYGQLAGSMPAPQLREMYSMCLSDARARIDSMRRLATQHDSAQFMRQAHTIKGSCGMLGAAELHRLTATLETLGPGTDAAAVNSLDELSAACDRLERMLGARA